jgi:hypothetical protein
MKYKLDSFSFIADVSLTHSGTACPADGFAMSFANVDDPHTAGNGGGSLGLIGAQAGGKPIPQFTIFEVNEYNSQGLGTAAEKQKCTSGKNETFAFDVVTPTSKNAEAARTAGGGTPQAGGYKIGQTLPPTGMKILNGGFFRFQWNVAMDGTLSVFVSGLDQGKNDQFQKVKVLEVKMDPSVGAINFEGRFGLSAATGGLDIGALVAHARIDSPMIEPQ